MIFGSGETAEAVLTSVSDVGRLVQRDQQSPI
jgi:hypothetical protein